MSSEVDSLSAHRVLLSSNTRNDEHKDVIERIPVEIWREILLICIACPFLIQRYGGQYCDIVIRELDCDLAAKYKQSERIRTRLRLVCQSWNQFLDEHSDRLVQLTPRVQSGYWPPVKRWDRVVRISGPEPHCCFCDKLCWPPCFHAGGWMPDIDPHISRTEIPDRLTQLSERCKTVLLPEFWRDVLVELPGLRSVTMLKETLHGRHDVGMKMSALSNAYRKLTYLEILVSTINDPSVGLELPFLASLRLEIRKNRTPHLNAITSCPAGTIGTWNLPNIRLIEFDVMDASEDEISAFNLLIRQVGRTVSTLIFRNRWGSYIAPKVIFPIDLWSACPALTCLGMSLREILSSPGPPRNPAGLLVDIRFDTTDMFEPSLAEGLPQVFPTKWPPSILGSVTLDMRWGMVFQDIAEIKSAEMEAPPYFLALFDVLHHTGKGLVDSAGIPFDSTIRSSLS